MKYVRLDAKFNNGTRSIVMMFPEDLVHLDVATVITVAMEDIWPTAAIETISAGQADVHCKSTFGRSGSLHLNAKEEDAALFNTSDYGGHIS